MCLHVPHSSPSACPSALSLLPARSCRLRLVMLSLTPILLPQSLTFNRLPFTSLSACPWLLPLLSSPLPEQVVMGDGELDGFRLKLIDTCGLEDPEAGDTVNYTVRLLPLYAERCFGDPGGGGGGGEYKCRCTNNKRNRTLVEIQSQLLPRGGQVSTR